MKRIYNHYEEREKARQFEWDCPIKIDLWEKYELEEDGAEIEKEMIDWIGHNTKGRVYCAGDMIFRFEIESDAELFKLTWG